VFPKANSTVPKPSTSRPLISFQQSLKVFTIPSQVWAPPGSSEAMAKNRSSAIRTGKRHSTTQISVSTP
jgi:hypothetical protein